MFGIQEYFNNTLEFAKVFCRELDEDQIRHFLGGLACCMPYGCANILANVTNVCVNTISRGVAEVKEKLNLFNYGKKLTIPFCATVENKKVGRPRCEDKQPLLNG